MTNNTTYLFKAAFALMTLGIFAFIVSAPLTLNNGVLAEKAAYAAKGKGSEGTGEANDDTDDGTADQGGGNDDDGPDAPDAGDDDGTADQGGGNDDDGPDAPDAGDDDGTADQGPGDN